MNVIMMKKFEAPELEMIRFRVEATTVSMGDTYNMTSKSYENTDADAKDTKSYGGLGWNTTLQ